MVDQRGDKMGDKVFARLWVSAQRTLKNAYSPYSDVKVACALITESGKIFTGCNVENASYGATMCAERTAIFKAVSEGHKKFKALLVLTNQKEIWPPCGLCRQVMVEFCRPSMPVYSANLRKEFKKMELSELLPFAFGPAQLI